MEFVTALISVIGTVFTEYVPDLAGAIVQMFSGLFWTAGETGGLTILGQALIAIAAIAIVSSIFHIVYRIFRGRMKRRV